MGPVEAVVRVPLPAPPPPPPLAMLPSKSLVVVVIIVGGGCDEVDDGLGEAPRWSSPPAPMGSLVARGRRALRGKTQRREAKPPKGDKERRAPNSSAVICRTFSLSCFLVRVECGRRRKGRAVSGPVAFLEGGGEGVVL